MFTNLAIKWGPHIVTYYSKKITCFFPVDFKSSRSAGALHLPQKRSRRNPYHDSRRSKPKNKPCPLVCGNCEWDSHLKSRENPWDFGAFSGLPKKIRHFPIFSQGSSTGRFWKDLVPACHLRGSAVHLHLAWQHERHLWGTVDPGEVNNWWI